MSTSIKETNLLVPKILVVLYLIIGLVPRFKAVDPIGSHWVYLGVVDLLALWFLFSNRDNFKYLKTSRFVATFFYTYGLFIFVAGLSIFFALNVGEGIKDISRLLITFVGVLNFYFLVQLAPKRIFEFVVKVSHFTIVAVAIQVIAIFAEDFGAIRSGVLLKKTELMTFGTQNATAATLVMQLPFVLYGVLYHTNRWKLVSYASFFLGALGIFFISARTSVISFLLLLCLTIIYQLFKAIKSREKSTLLLRVTFPILGFSALAYLLVVNVNRVDPSRMTTFNELIFSRSASVKQEKDIKGDTPNRGIGDDSTREYYYSLAFEDFKTKPLTGVGLGNWKLANKDSYFSTLNRSNFIYPLRTHNDFLQMLAETGIIGGLAYFSMFVLLAFLILKLFFKYKDDELRYVYFTLVLCLLVYGLDALINFPMERTPMQGHFIVLSAFICGFYTLSRKRVANPSTPKQTTQLSPIALGLLAAVVFVSTYFSYVRYNLYVAHNYLLADTSKKNLLVDDYVLTYEQVKKDLAGIYTLSGIGRPSEHLKAMYAMNEGNDELALKHLDKAIAQAPNHYESMMLKAIIYNQRIVNRDSAIYWASIGFKKYPSEPNNYKILLKSYAEKKDTINYMNTIEQKITRNPKLVDEWVRKIQRTQSYYSDKERTLAVIHEALEIHPEDPKILSLQDKLGAVGRKDDLRKWYADALAFMEERENEKAKIEFLKILDVMPSNIAALVNLGILEIRMKQYEEAVDHLSKVIDSGQFNDGRPEYNRGLAYSRMGKADKAAQDWQISKKRGFNLAQKLSKKQLGEE